MSSMLAFLLSSCMLYLLWWSVYDLFFSICSLFVKKEKLVNNEDEFFFIVIPALGEGQVLFNTIERALAVDYPQDKFQVVLLAQNIDESVSKELRKFPIKIIESGPLGSKMNAIRNWLKNEELTSESMFILDADNEILPKALSICSGAMKSTKCVQLTRKKTEPTSPLGLLDRWNTEVGIAIAIHSRLVLSRNPFIVGSGFGIKANLYQRFLDSNEDTIVEDKALDLFLIQQGEKPIYLRAPGVLDSSISRERQFTTQRSRWIGGKVQIKKLFRTAYFKETGNIELFDKWLHYSNPQRSIRLVLCLTWSFLYFLPNQELDAYYYLLPFALEIIAISIATPSYLISTDLFLAFLALPKSIIIIIKSRIIAKRTVGKDFKVTPK